MASYEIYYEYQITDINGDSAQTRMVSVNADTATLAGLATTAAATGALIAPLTNGKITSTGIHVVLTRAQISAGTAPPPADLKYPSVTDGARLAFGSTAGPARSVTIPAPVEAVFKTGTLTVNPAQSDVAAFITQMEAFTGVGGAANLYEGGVKTGRHARRRVTRKSL